MSLGTSLFLTSLLGPPATSLHQGAENLHFRRLDRFQKQVVPVHQYHQLGPAGKTDPIANVRGDYHLALGRHRCHFHCFHGSPPCKIVLLYYTPRAGKCHHLFSFLPAGVDLRSTQVAVAQKLLDEPDVGPAA